MPLLIVNVCIVWKLGLMPRTLTLKSCILYKSNWWELFSENLLGSILPFLSLSSINIEFLTLPVESFTTTLLPIPHTQPDPPRSTFLFPCPDLPAATANRTTKHLKPGINYRYKSGRSRLYCHLRPPWSIYWMHTFFSLLLKLPFKTNHQLTALNGHLFQARASNSIFYATEHRSLVASQIVDCLFCIL